MISMKRDTGLILHIMRWAQEQAKPKGRALKQPDFYGHDPECIREHIRLCFEAGYLEPGKNRAGGPDYGTIRRITWKGHDYLDSRAHEALTVLSPDAD